MYSISGLSNKKFKIIFCILQIKSNVDHYNSFIRGAKWELHIVSSILFFFFVVMLQQRQQEEKSESPV